VTYFRGILALAGFALLVLFAVPLQWLALRCDWPLQRRLPLLFCRLTCRLLGIRPQFHGRTCGRSPRMIAPNHVSWTDVLVLGCRQAPLRFVAKSEVAGWPLFGVIARLTGTIFVERQRRRSVLRVNAALSERLAGGEDVVVFAEATTGDGSRLKRFNAPHFAALRDFLRAQPQEPYATVTPVGLAYARRHGLPLGRLGRSEVAWYGDTALVPHLWMLVTRGGVDCEVTYGAPIRFERGNDRKAVARQTEAAVRRLVNLSLAGRSAQAGDVAAPEAGALVPELKAV
jgi:1-acyl-sn-glycerol-3-phosphate acyltransferase